MGIKKIPERYSLLMRGWNDVCCSRGKYSFTSHDDFLLESLTMMCRAFVLGHEGCVVLLYTQSMFKGKESHFDFLTVGQNEEKNAEMLVRLKNDDVLDYLTDKEHRFITTNRTTYELWPMRAIKDICECWVCNSGCYRAYQVVFGSKYGDVASVSGGAPIAYEMMWMKALAERSDMQMAIRAAKRYFEWKKSNK